MFADGGQAIADIDVLRHQGQVLGLVALPPTVWRTLDDLTSARLTRIDGSRQRWSPRVVATARRAARQQGRRWCLGEVVVLHVDAIVVAHSDKRVRSAHGHLRVHPLGVWCDNTTELLAARLRPGNAGANTAADHIGVLGVAIGQTPAAHRRNLLIRADGTGCSD
jgi:hypothetical protein